MGLETRLMCLEPSRLPEDASRLSHRRPPMATPPLKRWVSYYKKKEGSRGIASQALLETAGWKWVEAQDVACLKPLVCFILFYFYTTNAHLG